MRSARLALALAAALLVLAGCGSSDSGSSSSSSASSSTATSANAADKCTKAQLQTRSPGTLTVATDKPAYPPYFEDNDPTNGKGFESAVAYAIADQLGFAQERGQVDGRAVQLLLRARARRTSTSTSTRSRSRRRARSASTSRRRTTRADQAVVALEGLRRRRAPPRSPTSKDAKIGVQIGTTSLDAVNAGDPAERRSRRSSTTPTTSSPRSRRARSTRSWSTCRPRFYLTAAQVPNATIVGQFTRPRRRPVGRAAGEGLAAHRLRLARRSTSSSPPASCAQIKQQLDEPGRRRARCLPVAPGGSRRRPSDPAVTRPRRARGGAAAPAARGQAIAAVSTVVVLGGLAALDPDQPRLARRPRHVLLLDRLQGRPSRTCSRASGSTSSCSASSRSSCWSSAWSSRWCGRAAAPALFPLRLLAIVYTDVFRGIPTILLVYLVGFGIPALRARPGCRPTRSCSAASR